MGCDRISAGGSLSIHRTSLTAYAATMREPDPQGHKRLAKAKWHEDGTIVLFAEDVEKLDWQDRELVRAIAARHYGPRDEKEPTR